jgi:hypothetical protein
VAAPAAPTRNPHRPEAVKWLLGGLAVVLPLHLLFAVVVSEPYPAIMFPSFGKSPTTDSAVAPEPRFQVTFADGTTADIGADELLADIPIGRQAVLQKLFPRREPRELTGGGLVISIRRWVNRHLTDNGVFDPAFAGWLDDRVTDLHPGRDPVSLTMTWVDVEIEPSTGDLVSETDRNSYTVDLGGDR